MEFYNEILQANFFRYSVKDSSSYFCAISRKDSGQYLKQFCRQSLKESQEMFLTELQKCVGIFAGFFSRNSWNYHWKIYNKMFRGISMKEILRKKKSLADILEVSLDSEKVLEIFLKKPLI